MNTEELKNELRERAKILQSYERYDAFAEAAADYSGTLASSLANVGRIGNSSLRNYLSNPLKNYLDLSNIMEQLSRTNGLVRNNINYLTSMATLNHYIFPSATEESGFERTNLEAKDFLEAASFIERFRIKQYVPYFIKRTLINGYSLFYKMEDSDGVVYMEFPIRFGKIYEMSNGVYRWAADVDALSKLPEEILPSEIASAIQSKDRKGEQWLDDKHFKLSDSGVAFSFNMDILTNGGVTHSELVYLIEGAMKLENAKSKLELKDNRDNVKIVHSKIPLDKDGMPRMSFKTAMKYNNEIKKTVPAGVVPIVNPLEMKHISLNGAGDMKTYETVDRATSELIYDMGVPDSMFGAKVTSSNLAQLSNIRNASWIFSTVLPAFESYYNYEMQKFENNAKQLWRIKFLNQSIYSKKEDISQFKDQLTLGGSRMMLLAASGMSPLEVANLLNFEQSVLNIDELMVAKASSHTMSGGSKGGRVGRPEESSPTDESERVKNYS